MRNRDVGGRRLDLGAALIATLKAVPRLWLGGFGGLILLAAVWLAPMVVALSSWGLAVHTVALALAAVVVAGGLTRLAISPDVATARMLGLGPAGLQFAWAELRLIGAALLCLIFLAMVISILGLVVLAIFGMAELDVEAIRARDWAAVGPAWKLAVLAVVGAGAIAIPTLLAVRLSLFAPATLGRGHMVSLNSMGIAYGSFPPLLAGLVMTALPTLLAVGLAGRGLSQEARIAVGLVLIALQPALTLGFLGAAYRQLEYWTPGEAGS